MEIYTALNAMIHHITDDDGNRNTNHNVFYGSVLGGVVFVFIVTIMAVVVILKMRNTRRKSNGKVTNGKR